MAQIEVITGVERRRHWSEAEKRLIVAAAFAPGAVVTAVARRADISTALIYRWRRQLEDATRGFAEVVVAPISPPLSLGSHSTPSDRPTDSAQLVIEVAIDGNAQVRISALASPDLATAVIKALVGR